MNQLKTMGYAVKAAPAEEKLEIVPLDTSLIGTEQKTGSGVHLTLGELHLELDQGFDETTLKRVFQLLGYANDSTDGSSEDLILPDTGNFVI